MGGLTALFSGLLSLGASAGLTYKSGSEVRKANREYLAGHYSYAVQSEYDFNRARLYGAYDVDGVAEYIKRDYPRMTDFTATEIAEAAVAKRMMEEETGYTYKPSENSKFFNLDKYARDEFKKEVK